MQKNPYFMNLIR